MTKSLILSQYSLHFRLKISTPKMLERDRKFWENAALFTLTQSISRRTHVGEESVAFVVVPLRNQSGALNGR